MQADHSPTPLPTTPCRVQRMTHLLPRMLRSVVTLRVLAGQPWEDLTPYEYKLLAAPFEVFEICAFPLLEMWWGVTLLGVFGG